MEVVGNNGQQTGHRLLIGCHSKKEKKKQTKHSTPLHASLRLARYNMLPWPMNSCSHCSIKPLGFHDSNADFPMIHRAQGTSYGVVRAFCSYGSI